MEEEPIMCKRNLRLLISLCTIVTFIFAQDSTNVTVTLQSNGNLDYESDTDIYGFQFSQNGCVESATGGDAAVAGFTVSVGNNVLGFSFAGNVIPESEEQILLYLH